MRFSWLTMQVLCRFLLKILVLCGYIDLNTRICGSPCIYAAIVATLPRAPLGFRENIGVALAPQRFGEDTSVALAPPGFRGKLSVAFAPPEFRGKLSDALAPPGFRWKLSVALAPLRF